MSNEREFTGVFIPASIWNDERLSCVEKCFLAEVGALGGHRANCSASNEHLGKQVGVSSNRASVILSKLIEFGLVKTAGFDGRTRLLQCFYDTKADFVKTQRQVCENTKAETLPYKREGNTKEEDKRAALAVTQWQGHFFEQFGIRCTVRKSDEKMVAAILACGVSEDEFFSIAKLAWKNKDKGRDKFWCSKSVSLKTFCERFDEIRHEIGKTNHRNAGTVAPVTDYAEAAKRRAA